MNGRAHGNAEAETMAPNDRINLLRAVVRKIGYQFPGTPEGQLMHAVLGVAIADLLRPGVRESAERYLRGPMWHAQLGGVDPDWIRSQLMRAGLLSRRAESGSNSTE